jgi:hypothetical protein
MFAEVDVIKGGMAANYLAVLMFAWLANGVRGTFAITLSAMPS